MHVALVSAMNYFKRIGYILNNIWDLELNTNGMQWYISLFGWSARGKTSCTHCEWLSHLSPSKELLGFSWWNSMITTPRPSYPKTWYDTYILGQIISSKQRRGRYNFTKSFVSVSESMCSVTKKSDDLVTFSRTKP